MHKDYAKRRRSRYTKRTPYSTTTALPTWAWMVAGILLGVTLSFIVYWKSHHNAAHRPHDVMISMENKAGKTTQKSLAKAEITPEGKTRFDFYTLLPNLKIETTETTTAKQTTPNLPPAPKTTVASIPPTLPSPLADSYVIQTGSFRQLQQAEDLKAKLIIEGFNVSIQTYKFGGKETWHRVYIGPYSNKEQAITSQQKLEQAHALHSLIIKNRV